MKTLRHAGRRTAALLFAAAVLLVMPAALAPVLAQTLHAIIIADTDDPSIGVSVGKDYDKNLALMRAVAANTGMALDLKAISGAQLTMTNVKAAIAGLAVGSNDTVVFYYSGHGYRLWKKQDKYPYLYISQDGLDFNQVVGQLRAKKPRLLLAVTDSCNEYADKRPEARAFAMKRVAPQPNYRRLWLEARGEIVIASSSQGEFAWGDDAKGGYFTARFHEAHSSEILKSAPSWDDLLASAKAPITVSSGGTSYSQHPLVDSRISYETRVASTGGPASTPSVLTPTVRPVPVPAPALAWKAAANGQIPAGGFVGGQEPGRQLVVCRAHYGNGISSGKVVARNCNFGYGGREILAPRYEVLVANPSRLAWVAAANGQIPKNAVPGGQESGRSLAICRAQYGKGVHPGKVVGRNCDFGWGGREMLSPNYEVLVTK
jgi:hypothetical protein